MPDLLWDDVKNFFDPDLMGALPDVRVEDASVEDWQAVFDLVQTQGWTWEYSVGRWPIHGWPARHSAVRWRV
ncbi:hypothetical protein [Micromonospora sp. NPDC048898]|uniref:hypothetical protein n=1 Tax=Micromonospora sp. NPDC048898 TaxID=3364260 RepID=UPI003720F6AC